MGEERDKLAEAEATCQRERGERAAAEDKCQRQELELKTLKGAIDPESVEAHELAWKSLNAKLDGANAQLRDQQFKASEAISQWKYWEKRCKKAEAANEKLQAKVKELQAELDSRPAVAPVSSTANPDPALILERDRLREEKTELEDKVKELEKELSHAIDAGESLINKLDLDKSPADSNGNQALQEENAKLEQKCADLEKDRDNQKARVEEVQGQLNNLLQSATDNQTNGNPPLQADNSTADQTAASV